ncbi:MAG: hypothetical protein HY854_13805 [Burkholderiales bacterium]|nr:hypothetical protein [Burkholderiales bacterium]
MRCNNPVLVERIQGDPIPLKEQRPPRISAEERKSAVKSAMQAALYTAVAHCSMGDCDHAHDEKNGSHTICAAEADPDFTAVIGIDVVLENQVYCVRAAYTMRYLCECLTIPGLGGEYKLGPKPIPDYYSTLAPAPGSLDSHDTLSGEDGSDKLLLPELQPPPTQPPAKSPKGKGKGKGGPPGKAKPRKR